MPKNMHELHEVAICHLMNIGNTALMGLHFALWESTCVVMQLPMRLACA